MTQHATIHTWPRARLTGRGGYRLAGYSLAIALTAAGVPSPLYGVYQHDFRFSTGMLTVVYAVRSATLLPALLVAGPASDRFGRRPVLAVGVALTAVSAVLYLLADGLGWLLAARGMEGLGVAAVIPAATATITELQPAGNRARAALLATTATPAGLAAGSVVAGVLAQYAIWPTRLTFLIELVLLLAAVVAMIWLPESAPRADAAHGPGERLLQRPRVPDGIRREFTLAGLTVFAAWSVGALFLAVAPSYAARLADTGNLALLGAVPAVMFAAAVAGELAVLVLPARIASVTGLGLLVAGLAFVAAAFPSQSLAVLFGGALLCGAGLGLAFLGALTAVNELVPDHRRGALTAAFYVWLFTGNGLSVLVIGFLTPALSLSGAVYVFAGVIGVLALVTAAVTVAGRRSRSPV